MTTRERLLAISGIGHAEELKRLDDAGAEVNEYVKKINWFIDEFPALETQTEEALIKKDFDTVSNIIMIIRDMLAKIYANELSDMCNKLSNTLMNQRDGTAEALVLEFIAKVSALSIDVQMAVFRDDVTDQNAVRVRDGEKAEVSGNAGDSSKDEESGILAVDDASFFLQMLKAHLHNTGLKLTCVSSGAAALRFLMNNKPALFILDIEMPEMNGYELAVKIRERGHKAPIIFLTGNAKREYVVKAVQAGGSDFIVKPISKAQALERIGKFIKLPDPEEE